MARRAVSRPPERATLRELRRLCAAFELAARAGRPYVVAEGYTFSRLLAAPAHPGRLHVCSGWDPMPRGSELRAWVSTSGTIFCCGPWAWRFGARHA